MQLSTITDRLNDRLRTDAYASLDASPNGLQIGSFPHEVGRVGFAVDAVTETILEAAAHDVDLLVCHHGLIWGDISRVTGVVYDRVASLMHNDIALYVSHLPLDGHQDLGNAAGVADVLGLTNREPFACMADEPIGQSGVFPDPVPESIVAERLNDSLDLGGSDVRVLSFGPSELESVGIVTGSGSDYVGEAAAAGMDALITGEGKHQVYHDAKERGISVFLAGHYATETFGVAALSELVSAWGLETVMIDSPTGL